ncbi:MAG: hypothetical protein ACOC7J_07610 [Armatimonadota bacterium]
MLRKGSQGRVYYGTQTEQGTKGADISSPPPYYENFVTNRMANVEAVYSAGSRNPVELQEGTFGVEWSIDHPKVQGGATPLTYFELAIPSGDPEELTWFTWGFSDVDNDWDLQDCKMDSLEFSWEAGETNWLTASASGFGGLVTTPGDSYAAQTYIDAPGLAVHEGVSTAYEMTGGRSAISHNCEMRAVLLGPSGSRTQREWDYMPEGNEVVEGEYTLLNTSGEDMNAAEITSANETVYFTDKGGGGEVLSIEMTSVKPTNEEMTIPGADGDIEFSLPWLATALALDSGYP